MRRTGGLLLALTALLAVCGATTAEDAHAQVVTVVPPMNPRLIQSCATTTSDWAVTFTPNWPRVGWWSQTPSYGHPGCSAWVVDVHVPATAAQAPPGYTKEIVFTGDDPASDNGGVTSLPADKCSSYLVKTVLYKKAQGASTFTRIGGGFQRGYWVGPGGNGFSTAGCHVNNEAGYNIPIVTPPATGTDVYRVAVSVHVAGVQRTARMMAAHPFEPPR
jgi:hypothetical protein